MISNIFTSFLLPISGYYQGSCYLFSFIKTLSITCLTQGKLFSYIACFYSLPRFHTCSQSFFQLSVVFSLFITPCWACKTCTLLVAIHCHPSALAVSLLHHKQAYNAIKNAALRHLNIACGFKFSFFLSQIFLVFQNCQNFIFSILN